MINSERIKTEAYRYYDEVDDCFYTEREFKDNAVIWFEKSETKADGGSLERFIIDITGSNGAIHELSNKSFGLKS